MTPSITSLGESALLLTFADRVDRAIAREVRRAATAIERRLATRGVEVVPAWASLAVYFDRGRVSRAAVAEIALDAVQHAAHASEEPPSRCVTIPVTYDGPDLDEVAEQTGLARSEVIERHAARTYYAYMLGFGPGFAYLGDIDPALVLPRRPAPRLLVRPGSVAIGASYTAVYPVAMPGGWHLIGSTSLRAFDAAREPAALIGAGDEVRFVPVAP